LCVPLLRCFHASEIIFVSRYSSRPSGPDSLPIDTRTYIREEGRLAKVEARDSSGVIVGSFAYRYDRDGRLLGVSSDGSLGRGAAGMRAQTSIDGVAISALVEKFGSPLFVFSQKTLTDRFRELHDAFTRRFPKVRLAWSYKTNYLEAICRNFHREGAWAEVVSPFEYDKALHAGVSSEKIHWNGPYKPEAALAKAIEEGRAVFDNLKKFMLYVFTHNWAELVAFIVVILLRTSLPLTIIQILAIDLILEIPTSLSLTLDPPAPDTMGRSPRSRSSRIFDLSALARTMTTGVVIGVFVEMVVQLVRSRSGLVSSVSR